jgi:hypothetical protein
MGARPATPTRQAVASVPPREQPLQAGRRHGRSRSAIHRANPSWRVARAVHLLHERRSRDVLRIAVVRLRPGDELSQSARPGRDRPDGFEELAGRLSKAAHNQMMRECGFDAMILRDKGHDPVVARMRPNRQKRCAAEGCGRFAANGSLTRAQHGGQSIPF